MSNKVIDTTQLNNFKIKEDTYLKNEAANIALQKAYSVQDYVGEGNLSGYIDISTDWNTVITIGTYKVSILGGEPDENKHPAGASGKLKVENCGNAASGLTQTFIPTYINTNNPMKIRSGIYEAGKLTWSDWIPITGGNEGNIDTFIALSTQEVNEIITIAKGGSN